MRLLFVSTHTDQITGYSKVVYNLLQELVKVEGLQIFHFGFQKGNYERPKLPIIQFDAALNENPKEQGFGFNCFADYLKTVSPDVVFIYNDPLVVSRFLELIPKTYKGKIFVYLDQVYKYADFSKVNDVADKVFVFSNAWKLPIPNGSKTTQHILLHAPDTSVKNLPETEISEHKKKLKIEGKEVFLNINRNSSRKRLDLTLQAFAMYLKENPKAHLILVTGGKGHYHIPAICMLEKIPAEAISFIDTDLNRLSDEFINIMYNISDYGINTSNGEGFGLSTLEHAKLGKPQLVMDIGSYREFLTDEDSVLLKPTIRNYITPVGLGMFEETTTVENVFEGMKQMKTKSSPVVKLTWQSITQELKSMFQT